MRSFSASAAERDLVHQMAGDLTYEGLRRIDDVRWEIRNREEEENLRQMKAVTDALGAALDLSDSAPPQAALDASVALRDVVRLNPKGVQFLNAEDLIESVLDSLSRQASRSA